MWQIIQLDLIRLTYILYRKSAVVIIMYLLTLIIFIYYIFHVFYCNSCLESSRHYFVKILTFDTFHSIFSDQIMSKDTKYKENYQSYLSQKQVRDCVIVLDLI